MTGVRAYLDSEYNCSSNDTFSSPWRISDATCVQKHDFGEKHGIAVQLFREALHARALSTFFAKYTNVGKRHEGVEATFGIYGQLPVE